MNHKVIKEFNTIGKGIITFMILFLFVCNIFYKGLEKEGRTKMQKKIKRKINKKLIGITGLSFILVDI